MATRAHFSARFDLESIDVANSAQARKRAAQGEKRRQHNAAQRSLLRTRIKQVCKAIAAGDRDAALAAYQTAVPVIDRLADKDVIHKNKAARHKSALNRQIREMA